VKPRLLDLFCCQGGAGMGYHRAGFDVVGVDINPQPRYPFEFHQAEALWFLRAHWREFDAIHASPPCQAHSDLQKQSKIEYEDLIGPTRWMLERTSLPWVIENVEGAPLIDPVTICGAAVEGVSVIRHRRFESNVPLVGVPCPPEGHPRVFTYDERKKHKGRLDQNTSYVQVTGGGNCTVANKRRAMGTPWMTGRGCNEAIPPAYAEHIGRQLLAHPNAARVAA
jgi:DNA (cytosine-5)-methyltransferase 1